MKKAVAHGKAFISYRRDGSDALAELLKYRLSLDLPKWIVFHDHGSIPPGADFEEVVKSAIERADLLIALIDDNWVGKRPGQPNRILDERNFIRYEVREALRLQKRILPVLVNDAKMPKSRELPDDIVAMTKFNALELRISRFESDFPHLVQAISGRTPAKPSMRILGRVRQALGYAVAGAAVVIVGLVAQYKITGQPLAFWVGDVEAVVISALSIAAAALVARLIYQKISH